MNNYKAYILLNKSLQKDHFVLWVLKDYEAEPRITKGNESTDWYFCKKEL